MVADPEPLWVGEIDIADPPDALGGETATPGSPYHRARILARFQGEPLGLMTLPMAGGDIDVETARSTAAQSFGDRIAAIAGPGWDLAAPRRPGVSAELRAIAEGAPPAVSVVIGTRNRPDHVTECVQRVLSRTIPRRSR